MNKRIPLIDLTDTYKELQAELNEASQRVMSNGHYILGPEVAAFEKEFAAYCGCRYCIAVSNGADALRLILQANGIGPGDEVIVPAHTFIATWLAVYHADAKPVPADIVPGAYNLDPGLTEAAITPKTRAIIPVHLYGQPAEMAALRDIASHHGLLLIEDAAQAHGAQYQGQMAGSLGDAAAFSFYPTKNLGAFGDAGAIVCNDKVMADRMYELRHVGRDTQGGHCQPGFNCRMDELQAALLRVKLPHLDEWNRQRQELAGLYLDGLSDSGLRLPSVAEGMQPVWHLFVVRTPQRDKVLRMLHDQGIEAGVHYSNTPYLYPALSDLGYQYGTCPRAEAAVREVISLPLWPQMSAEQVLSVTATVKQVLTEIRL